MIDFLANFALSNLCLSLGIALVAWLVHRGGKWPHLAHLLWGLVLAKLVTPPLVTIPLGDPGIATNGFAEAVWQGAAMTGTAELAAADGAPTAGQESSTAFSAFPLETVKLSLVLLWGLGSAALLAWSAYSIARFNRILRTASETAPPELHATAVSLARRIGLKRTPEVCMTSARLSPLVWWIGGRVHIVLPETLTAKLTEEHLRCILAHELSHVKRRDHLLRWLEWLACILFWWNPVAWWARRNLRINEEICCDALVLASLTPQSRNYANALVTAVESLAPPPAMASGIGGGSDLERRLTMILSNRVSLKPQCWLRPALLCGCLLLPLGAGFFEQRAHGSEESSNTVSAPDLGVWSASSALAQRTTGDIRIGASAITFANAKRLPIEPLRPETKTVFAVDPAADPAMLRDKQLCNAPITYVTLATYNDFALAMHLYEGAEPPAEPTPDNVTAIARRGKCASYYYHATP